MYAIFEKEFTITDNMCGKNLCLKPSGILDILQTIAGEHADILHIGYDDITKLNLAFVIARVKYDLYKPIKRYSKIKVVTWPKEVGRIEMDRDYEFYDVETNELLLKACSKWILIDITTRRICRSNSIPYPTNIYPKSNYDEFKKLEFNEEMLVDTYDYVVRYCDLDVNNHMNNTKYSDVVKFKTDKICTRCQLDYVHELILDDLITIKSIENDKELYVLGKSNNSVSFKAYFKFF